MTGFSLTPGYPFSNCNVCDVSDILEVAKSISLLQLRKKAIEYGVSKEFIDEYVASYRKIPSDDLTIQLISECILQTASGINPSRDIKEKMRRAFGILVLDECYRRGWSVSFTID